MKKILVPTDFSDCAGNAVEFAVQSAKILPAEITLLHAESQLHDIENKLEVLKENIEQRHDIIVHTQVREGSLKETIDEATKAEKFDLIIMGTLGAGGLKEKLWGSNTAAIIGMSKIPVLAIPHEYAWRKPEKFLLATGNFEKGPATLDAIFELAALYMAHVDIAVFTEENDEAVAFLEHARNAPWYQGLLSQRYGEETLSTAQLSGRNFERTLQDHIRDNNIDVLVMITYKRGFLEKVLHPSHTKKMSYHTIVPLLAVPADQENI